MVKSIEITLDNGHVIHLGEDYISAIKYIGDSESKTGLPASSLAFKLFKKEAELKELLDKLEIYNILGKRIRTLVNDLQDAGSYEIIWYAKDDHDNSVSSGIYFLRFMAEKTIDVKKVLLLR